jgi:hypothetical protein
MHLKGLKMMLTKYFKNSKKKYYWLLVIIGVFFTNACAKEPLTNNTKSVPITQTIQKIYLDLKTKNYDSFNQTFIHKKYGLFVIYRLGISDTSMHVSSLGELSKKIPFHSLNYAKTIPTNIKWKPVEFNCEEEKWSKNGYFLQKIKDTDILKKYIKNNDQKDTKILQNRLYRFVDTVNGLVFYMTFIEQHWYIIILDEVTGNCDA